MTIFWGQIIIIFHQAIGELWRHKLRSFLTMFGIAWGILSIILLTAAGEGFRIAQQDAAVAVH